MMIAFSVKEKITARQRLEMNDSPLDAGKIRRLMDLSDRLRTVDFLFFETATSTNDEARAELLRHRRELVVLARRQTAGRGRLDHRWESQIANNIYLSFGLPKLLPSSNLQRLVTLYAGSIVRALQGRFSIPLSLKFPNDLMLNGAKVGGLLAETVLENRSALLGIGLNLQHDGELQRRCEQPISSLSSVRTLDPSEMVYLLTEIFFESYNAIDG